MAFLFAVIALLAIAALAIMAGSSGNTHKPQNQHQPNSQNTAANSNITADHEQKANDGAEVHEPQNYWERFVGFIERREKFITATSTIFIAAFTVILGIATAFLYIATRNLVSGTEETAERQLRAYVGLKRGEDRVINFFCPDCNLPQSVPRNANDLIGRNGIVMTLKNYGQTPAYQGYVCARLWEVPVGGVLTKEIVENEFAICDANQNKLFMSTIWPTEERPSSLPLGERQIEIVRQARARRVDAFLFGRIQYVDIFKRQRYSYFCYQYLYTNGIDNFATSATWIVQDT